MLALLVQPGYQKKDQQRIDYMQDEIIKIVKRRI